MECAAYREAVSARIDGEETGLEADTVDAHLAECPACGAWAEAAIAVTRSARVGLAEPVPNLADAIVAAMAASAEGTKGTGPVARGPGAVAGWARRGPRPGGRRPAATTGDRPGGRRPAATTGDRPAGRRTGSRTRRGLGVPSSRSRARARRWSTPVGRGAVPASPGTVARW